MTARVLVIGYGNVLRADDGIGWRVAEALADDRRLTGVTVIGRHQLTPELAFDLSEADYVVLVDAQVGPAAGTVNETVVERDPARHDRRAPMTHHVGPRQLLDLAAELYDRTPMVAVVSVGIGSLELGDPLTPEAEAAIPVAAEAVVASIDRFRRAWAERTEVAPAHA